MTQRYVVRKKGRRHTPCPGGIGIAPEIGGQGYAVLDTPNSWMVLEN